MAKMKQKQGRRPRALRTHLSAEVRVALAFGLPIAGALLLSVLASGLAGTANGQTTAVPLLGGIGVVSWLLGLRWYGLPGMGLRGGRPLFASIGFTTLGWVAFLILRFFFVPIETITSTGAGRAFVYLLLFEAFAVQLWTFGLLFRSLADWRGPLTAAVGSGILFGAVAFLLFRESFTADPGSLLYFALWGVLYGIIRLRSGSLLGAAIIQALHTFSAWIVLAPPLPPPAGPLQSLYLGAAAAYLVIIWRLWPKEVEDYRV